ncbi:MAG: MurT ligase domain-containing protein [Candidatus Limnocylindria bacterium]|nr:MurT ligase domain-containing protein [Candidatus Limnocylindria bacterium]
MPGPRSLAALWAGKAVRLGLVAARRGATALPGLVALALDPRLLRAVGTSLAHGAVCVTGTNGKTTTARMLAAMAREAGWAPVHNRAGSNLDRGIAATLLADATWRGVPRSDVGVFEVDEASVTRVLAGLAPRVVVVTNLFRDQLDRYGELDALARRMAAAIAALPPTTTLVLNADDPLVTVLGDRHRGAVTFFGIDDPGIGTSDARDGGDDSGARISRLGVRTAGARDGGDGTGTRIDDPGIDTSGARGGGEGHSAPIGGPGSGASVARDVGDGTDIHTRPDATGGAAGRTISDATRCPRCRAPLAYRRVVLAHEGDWSCAACGFARPSRDVAATRVAQEAGGLTLTVAGEPIHVPLRGAYNAANALAALAAAAALGIPRDAAVRALATFRPAFGRQETLDVDGRRVRLLLVKNPAGFDAAVASLAAPERSLQPAVASLATTERSLRLLVALSDRDADGRDVSWIWDCDVERLAPAVEHAVVTGLRAEDLALRLKYAGLARERTRVTARWRPALEGAIAATPRGGELVVLATYTAMQALRAELARAGHASRFWED